MMRLANVKNMKAKKDATTSDCVVYAMKISHKPGGDSGDLEDNSLLLVILLLVI